MSDRQELSQQENTGDQREKVSGSERISKKDRIDIWIKIITLVFTTITVLVAGLTYIASQKWKVAEFMSSKINEYSQNKSVKTVKQLLDYNQSNIVADSLKIVLITDDVLYEALVIDTIRSEFSVVELKIRNLFDEYFDKQSEFNRYIEAGVFDADKLRPFLTYEISILADTVNNHKKSNELKCRIWDYIVYYGYSDVVKLYEKMGHPIKN